MALIWIEDFESATGATSQVGVTRNAADRNDTINGDNDGGGDFSFRSNQPNDGSLGTYPAFFTGLQGFGWLAEDTDSISGAASTVETLNWAGIDITGQTTLEFSGLIGAYDNPGSGNIHRWEADEFISVQVQIDGGGFTEILRFESDNAGGASGNMRIDTNGDGVGDGTLLTVAMQEITASISGTGSTLDLRIEFTTNSANENLAFDNISITDGQAAAIDGTPNADTLSGTSSDDVINGLAGNDTLAGFEGNDTINGDAGNDRLLGGDGDDALNGGDNNDQLFGEGGADALDGGAGIDGVYYLTSTSGVTLNTFAGGSAGDAAGDTYTSIERFFGSNFADNLTGAAGNDYLAGLGGNDIINGAGGNDILVGGLGVDTINGGDDNDTILGSQGGDLLNGDGGNDTLRGGADNDMLNGGDGNDSLDGGTGADALDGGAGVDRAMYTSATAGVDANLATGGTGGDAVGDTYNDIENLYGSFFSDTLEGDSNANLIVGLLGNDDLFGHGGNDRLIGSAGEDYLDGGDGNDILIGQADADTFAFRGSSSVGELDRIIDFEDGVDTIELELFGFVDNFGDLILTQVGNHVRVEEDTGATGSSNDAAILVYNTMVADLTADDFNIISPPPTQEPLDDNFTKLDETSDAFAGIEFVQLPLSFNDGHWELMPFDADFDALI